MTSSARRRAERAAIGPAIELRHLRYFLAVSEELHFRRAAERLHVAQPPLSQAIRKLEEALGVPLLERTSRGVTPTRAGLVFAEEARHVLASFDRAVGEARRAGGTGSSLRIGSTPDLPIERLLRFLGGLREQDPSLQPQVTHLSAPEQVSRLQDGDLDLGIFPLAADHPKLELEPLFPGEPLVAFVPSGHPLSVRPVLSPKELAAETLVTFPRAADPALADRLGGLLNRAGYRFRAVREAPGPQARDQVLAVAAGFGIAVLPASFREVGEPGAVVARRPLKPQVTMPETVVAWSASLPAQLRLVITKVSALAGELRRWPDDLVVGGHRLTQD